MFNLCNDKKYYNYIIYELWNNNLYRTYFKYVACMQVKHLDLGEFLAGVASIKDLIHIFCRYVISKIIENSLRRDAAPSPCKQDFLFTPIEQKRFVPNCSF